MQVIIESIYAIMGLVVMLHLVYFGMKNLKKYKDKEHLDKKNFNIFLSYYYKIFFSGTPILLVATIQLGIVFPTRALELGKTIICGIVSLLIIYNWFKTIKSVKKKYINDRM
jgi:phosphatidylserine synthase